MFLFSATFVGVVILTIGITQLFKHVFKVQLQSYKALFAFVLIYLGIVVMSGDVKFGPEPQANTILFRELTLNATDPNADYGVYFARGTFDYTTMPMDRGNIYIESNTLFAKHTMILKGDAAMRIIINPSICVVKFPDGRVTIPFFKTVFKTRSYDDNAKAVTIKSNVVFGSIEIVER
jgi:predicted membrane protein